MIRLIAQFLERREERKQAIAKRKEALQNWPEEYRNAEKYIKENCDFEVCNPTGIYPVEIRFDSETTIRGLKKLSIYDKRTTAELEAILKGEENWSEYQVRNFGYTPRFRHLGGFDNWIAEKLQKAVLAVRITSDKTLRYYFGKEGILGRIFVDWNNPLKPYKVIGTGSDEWGYFAMETDDNSCQYNKMKKMTSHLDDRELKQ